MAHEQSMLVSEIIGSPSPLLAFPLVRPAFLLLRDNAVTLKKGESNHGEETIAEFSISEETTIRVQRNVLSRNREVLSRVLQLAPLATLIFIVVRTFRLGPSMSYSRGDVLTLVAQAAVLGLVLSLGHLFVGLKRLPDFAFSVVRLRSATSKFPAIVMSEAQIDILKPWCGKYKVQWS